MCEAVCAQRNLPLWQYLQQHCLQGGYFNKGKSTEVSSECVNHKLINPQSIDTRALICSSNSQYFFIPWLPAISKRSQYFLGSNLIGGCWSQSFKFWIQKELSICLYVPKRTPRADFWQALCASSSEGWLQFTFCLHVYTNMVCKLSSRKKPLVKHWSPQSLLCSFQGDFFAVFSLCQQIKM